MQFLTSLFGPSGATMVTATFALGAVLVLIVLSVWLLKFVFKASGSVVRGRNRRLTVIDALQVDTKRQLLIVRRDNVEHLILTGGPQDLLVETGIAVDPGASAHAVPDPAAGHASLPERAQNAQPAGVVPRPSAVERLKDLTRPGKPKSSPSLRHTGLMRSAGRPEVVPGNLNNPARDSARTSPLAETKGGKADVSWDGAKPGS